MTEILTVDFGNPQLPLWEMTARLLLAALFGLLVGWEREILDKDAGLRTHMFVGLGACSFMLVVLNLTISPPGAEDIVSIDPSRVIQGLIGGIGFLGAGAIIHGGGDQVRGITTGAGIWLVGAVGLACGAGAYLLATMITLLAVVIVLACSKIFKPIARKSRD